MTRNEAIELAIKALDKLIFPKNGWGLYATKNIVNSEEVHNRDTAITILEDLKEKEEK